LRNAACAGNKATLNFYLTSFSLRLNVTKAIEKIEYGGGGTNTADGLRLMRTEIFNHANGDRRGVQNVAILITDGDPDNRRAVLSEIAAIKRAGVRIVGVAVGSTVSLFSAFLSFFLLFQKPNGNGASLAPAILKIPSIVCQKGLQGHVTYATPPFRVIYLCARSAFPIRIRACLIVFQKL